MCGQLLTPHPQVWFLCISTLHSKKEYLSVQFLSLRKFWVDIKIENINPIFSNHSFNSVTYKRTIIIPLWWDWIQLHPWNIWHRWKVGNTLIIQMGTQTTEFGNICKPFDLERINRWLFWIWWRKNFPKGDDFVDVRIIIEEYDLLGTDFKKR